MKATKKSSSAPAEFAQTLRALADRIDGNGPIEFDGASFTLPAAFALKLKFAQKEAKTKFKITVSWPGENMGSGGPARVEGTGLIEHYELPRTPPAALKPLKKEMQHALYYFRHLAEAGNYPSPEEIERYRALQRAFAGMARGEWGDGIVAADRATDDLAAAAESEDPGGVAKAVERLLAVKKIYHERYK